MNRDPISRISALAASLRRCLATVSKHESSWSVRSVEAELSELEKGVDQLADDLMIAAWQRESWKRCHCGAPKAREHETCGANHCRATAREARAAIRRYERRHA